jgi:tetratricopeptide (TPR) repeat protein
MSGWVSSGFVGRLEELRALSGCLDEARAGTGRLVVISGEGGVGKTRLCEEFASIAGSLGAGVAWAACWESGGLPPFWPWQQLLDQLGVDLEPTPLDESPPDVARAHLFAAVIDVLRAAVLARPRLLVLDDVQWADAGTIRLLTHAGPLLRSTGALLVATVRETDIASPSLPRELLRHARVIRLGGLHVDELSELVEGLTGTSPKPEVNGALHRATAGNPLFAGELVRRLSREGRLDRMARNDDFPSSPTVRAVLDEQLTDLSEHCRELLAIAAVVGREFPLRLIADVAGRDPVEVLVDIEEAVTGGVVTTVDVGRYAFAHPLLRSVMHDDIGVARRVQLHEQIGDALERDGARRHEIDLAALSYHYLNAAPGGTAGKAVHYAERAARSAMAALGYEDAVELFDRALVANELDPNESDRGSLLLGAGDARAAMGDTDGARAAFLSAADHARRAGRPPQLATAALGLGGTGFEVALFDDQQIALLEEALDALGDDESALRSRISARLSVALSLAGREQRRMALSESAVRLAHQAADPAALAYALAARCDAHAGPADVAQRAADAGEIVRIAEERGDHGTELLGRRLRLVAALEQGDMNAVDAEVHAFAQAADWLRQPQYQWYVPLWRAMRAAMRGRLADQQALSREAEELGRAAASVNTDILLLAHRWFAWLDAGDVETAVAQIDVLMPPGTYTEMGAQMVPLFVVHRLLSGRAEEARAMLDGAADDVRLAHRDSEWLTMAAQVGDACFRLGGHELAQWLYDALAPFADMWAVDGIGAYAHGPVHRQLGQLAVLLGRRDAATRHFDAALVGNRRAGADLLAARTLFDRGVALDEPETLRAARDVYRELGVDGRVEEIESLLRGRTATPSDPAGARPEVNQFRREGDVWTVSFGARRCRVRDSKGIRDIVRLLVSPGREIPALDLAAPGTSPARGDLGETVDAEARAAYKARLVELEAELDAADAASDTERSLHAQAERDALVDQLASAYGLAGRPRRTGDPAERARTAVTARIRDAIRRVEVLHPELGRHLARSVRTGTLCSYDPDQPVRWEL